ncbi:pyridoxal kinase PdxY [Corynebacterium sp. KPL2861]|uniref:pyridoxal kinase PdxY n=1 Tax=unclassified Corynebacterium TaxID=2624378 RepID=UPI0003B7EC3D|nr:MULTISPECIES: pyridoxal kinase PdxY [unclassified Corynebacterium]ERS57849.1 pyridoxamine kinase [Corynebacterium sp. KPL1855]ERS64734.1 pyridoxamine kinase [Corynebacterium sp. KPL1814]ERS80268.1 pyridoxamine kinase [Corynebacterium sp. KPL1859]
MTILSIQSHVTYGHVGNSAAVFPLQRAGHEVWPVHTVNFSNHTGYGDWGGPMIPASDVTSIIDGIEKRGAFEGIDAILSGYQGGSDIADAIVDTVRRIKAVNPKALYACDPVMGNAKSGCFVSDDIPPLLRDRVVPVADIITPNQFELGYLTGTEVNTLDQTLAAVKKAQEMGPKTVLVTSVKRPETPADQIEMLAVDGERAFLLSTPLLPVKRNGSGDVTAALFTGHYVETDDVKEALRRTASSVYELLRTTYEAESTELQLIQAQDAFAHPSMQFQAEEL